MSDTLGTLVDKICTVSLKEWHTTVADRLVSLATQRKQLQSEIDAFIANIGPDSVLSAPSNKVCSYTETAKTGTLGELIGELVLTTIHMWALQELVYDEPELLKCSRSELLAYLQRSGKANLERNWSIDRIDKVVELCAKN